MNTDRHPPTPNESSIPGKLPPQDRVPEDLKMTELEEALDTIPAGPDAVRSLIGAVKVLQGLVARQDTMVKLLTEAVERLSSRVEQMGAEHARLTEEIRAHGRMLERQTVASERAADEAMAANAKILEFGKRLDAFDARCQGRHLDNLGVATGG